jgi:hypothetical protein
MQNAANLTTHVPTLHHMLMEQQHMIDRLQEQLRLALRRQFGPRNEHVNIDQIGLFAADAEADTSTVIELSEAAAENIDAKTNAESPAKKEPAQRKKAVRILKDLPRDIRIIDIPNTEKFCSCCDGELHHFGDECSEQLGYVPASVKIIETRRKKYACKSCHGEVKRAKDDSPPPIAKSMASAMLDCVSDRVQIRRSSAAVPYCGAFETARHQVIACVDVGLVTASQRIARSHLRTHGREGTGLRPSVYRRYDYAAAK